MPKISVCIPAYNSVNHIGKTIQSVLSQTMEDFELIILDDKSTDGTPEVIKMYSDPRINVICHPQNLGFEGNWNQTIETASGEFYKLLPGDDVLYPTCLEKQLAILEAKENSDVAMVCCARDIIDQSGKKIMQRCNFSKDIKIDGIKAVKQSVRSGSNLFGEPGAVLFRRSLLEKAGPYDGSNLFLIDMDMWCKILLNGKLYVLTEPLAAFRVSSGSYSVKLRGEQAKWFKEFIQKLASDRRFKLSTLDCIQGGLMAELNAILRYLVYKFVIR